MSVVSRLIPGVVVCLLVTLTVLTFVDAPDLEVACDPFAFEMLKAEMQRAVELEELKRILHRSITNKIGLVEQIINGRISLDQAIAVHESIEETPLMRASRHHAFPAQTDHASRRQHLLYMVEIRRTFLASDSHLPSDDDVLVFGR